MHKPKTRLLVLLLAVIFMITAMVPVAGFAEGNEDPVIDDQSAEKQEEAAPAADPAIASWSFSDGGFDNLYYKGESSFKLQSSTKITIKYVATSPATPDKEIAVSASDLTYKITKPVNGVLANLPVSTNNEVLISYKGVPLAGTETFDVAANAVKDAELEGTPKVDYVVNGGPLVLNDLKVVVNYMNGKSEKIVLTVADCDTVDFTSTGSVTVNLKDIKLPMLGNAEYNTGLSFNININEAAPTGNYEAPVYYIAQGVNVTPVTLVPGIFKSALTTPANKAMIENFSLKAYYKGKDATPDKNITIVTKVTTDMVKNFPTSGWSSSAIVSVQSGSAVASGITFLLQDVVLNTFTVDTVPTKTAYYELEKFDGTGLVATLTYTDGTTVEKTAAELGTDLTYAGFDTAVGQTGGTISAFTYKTKVDTAAETLIYTVTPDAITGYTAQMPLRQQNYLQNAPLDLNGLKMVATYESGKVDPSPIRWEDEADRFVVTGFSTAALTNLALATVTFTPAAGAPVVFSFNYAVLTQLPPEEYKQVQSIAIKIAPTKDRYAVNGGPIDPTGGVVTVTFVGGGNTLDIPMTDSRISFSAVDFATTGTKAVNAILTALDDEGNIKVLAGKTFTSTDTFDITVVTGIVSATLTPKKADLFDFAFASKLPTLTKADFDGELTLSDGTKVNLSDAGVTFAIDLDNVDTSLVGLWGDGTTIIIPVQLTYDGFTFDTGFTEFNVIMNAKQAAFYNLFDELFEDINADPDNLTLDDEAAVKAIVKAWNALSKAEKAAFDGFYVVDGVDLDLAAFIAEMVVVINDLGGDIPITGDNNSMLLWVLVAAALLAVVATGVVMKKRGMVH